MRYRKPGTLSSLHFLSLGSLICCSATLYAQAGRGAMSGTVMDPSGAIVPGAIVLATDTARGTKLSTITTAAGIYSFVSVPSGSYDLTVSHEGFDTAVEKGVTVSVDAASKIDLTMVVGSLSQTVTVDESASLVGASNSIVGQLISAAAIDRVPLVTRNVYQLTFLDGR